MTLWPEIAGTKYRLRDIDAGGVCIEIMDGCGHWPQFEDAPTFNRLPLDFPHGA
jgi:hypothetical protein